jgi:hypothetical protein
MARRALIPPPTAYDERSASRSLESIGSDATGSARAGHGCQTGSKAFRSAGKTPFPGREAGVGLAPPAGCCVREVQLVKPRGEMRKMSPALAVKTLSYSRTCADCGCVACLCGDAVEPGCGAWLWSVVVERGMAGRPPAEAPATAAACRPGRTCRVLGRRMAGPSRAALDFEVFLNGLSHHRDVGLDARP